MIPTTKIYPMATVFLLAMLTAVQAQGPIREANAPRSQPQTERQTKFRPRYQATIVPGGAMSSATSSAKSLDATTPIANSNSNLPVASGAALPSLDIAMPQLAPLGSPNVSPQSMNYQSSKPVYLRNSAADPGPIRGRWVSQPFGQPLVYEGSGAQEKWHEDNDREPEQNFLDPMPHDAPPDHQPPRRTTLSTALPMELSVPTQVPVGLSTGHRTVINQFGRPNVPTTAGLRPPSGSPFWAGPTPLAISRCLKEYPIGGIGATPPEKLSGPGVGPPGLGYQYFDRFFNGGYGETDVDSRRASRLQQAMEAGQGQAPPTQ